MEGKVGGLGEKSEGIKKCKLVVTKQSHKDVEYSIGSVVNNTRMAVGSASGY